MPGIGFTVEPDAFVGLSPDRSVALFRQLLWAEADRVGIGRHLIDVPDCINVGDGGVDAYIDNACPSDDDVIPRGSTVFQIKSADLPPMACRQELHVMGDLSKPLKDELNLRLQQGAAYVLVLSADVTDARIQARLDAIRRELSDFGYENSEVRVYGASHLAGFTNRHPSLVVSLRPELSNCSPYVRWGSSHDVRFPTAFVADPSRQALVDQITTALRERTGCPVIRLTGLPGVGKTRSAYEALRPDDLKNQVLYVRRAEDLMGSPLLYALVNDPTASAILVVDECNLEQHRELANALAEQGTRLALITMSYEVGYTPMPTVELHAAPLQQETVEEILELEYPGLPTMAARRLAEFADGYPHIAVLLAGQAVNEGASEAYFSVPDDSLMNRLIGGSAPSHSDQFRTTKKVLMGLSLFQRIGVAGIGESEGRWLASRVGVSWQELQEVLSNEKGRGTVQGEHFVFVTPFMLRIHLLEEWWRAHGLTDEATFNEFVSSMPNKERPDLLRRFFEHFPYVAAAPRGAKFVQAMLAEGGVASDYELLNSDLGGRFFLALTEAEPVSSLRTAERVLSNKSREELLQFHGGRRAMVEVLTRMAVWRELFQPAARLLLALAEAETESWANNASGEFANLFSLGTGQVAPTEAPPSERFSILSEALSSDSPERRRLGLQACQSGLKTGAFHRTIGAEYQGVRREPELWQPATYGELFDAYRSIWKLTTESLDFLDAGERVQAVSVLLSSARGLTRIGNLVDMVVDTLRDLASDPSIDRKDLIGRTAEILHYDGRRMEVETRHKWERLAEELSGHDFSSRIERYVALDLLVDQFNEEGQQVDKAQPLIEELAVQAIEEPGLLRAELDWLVTKRATAGHRFGYELGKRDSEQPLLPHILDAQAAAGDDGDLSFLGGYLSALAERDPSEWESLLDRLAQDTAQAEWVVELTWRSGRLSERASRRVLSLVGASVSAPETLRMFRYGATVRSLTPEDFSDWVDVLLESDNLRGASAALDLLVMYGGYNQSKEPARKIVCHPSWFSPPIGSHHPSHDAFWWAHVAEALCKHHPDVALELATLMLEHAGEEGTIVKWLDDEPGQVLDEVIRQNPWAVWQIASSLLGPPIDGRAFVIGQWLRGSEMFESGGSHILQEVPPHMLWTWADEDPDVRPLRLAGFVPRAMCGPHDSPCLARELLLRYGHDPRVRSELRANFSTEGWTGAMSQHLLNKSSWLLGLRNQETNSNVLTWIDEYIAEIEHSVEYFRQVEEREGR